MKKVKINSYISPITNICVVITNTDITMCYCMKRIYK